MELYDYQKKVVEHSMKFNSCLLAMDMGLGKTPTGTEVSKRYGDRIVVVICQKSKIKDWCDHLSSEGEGLVIDYRNNQELTSTDFIMYSKHSRVWIVMNYELAWRRPQLKTIRDFTLMLDESSLIQNTKAKQTQFVLKLKPNHVVLLSGTPCSGYEKLWTQSTLIGWNIGKTAFNERYVNWDLIKVGSMYHKVVSKRNPYKNVDELKEKLREHGAVFMKTEEVIELPEQRFIESIVPSTTTYRKFLKNKVVELNGREIIGDSIFGFRLGLRELASQYSEDKIQALKDMLDSTEDRLIVFYNFNEELRIIEDLCVKACKPTSLINGKTKDLEAYEENSNSVTIVQYQAGAMGLNLQKANKMIFFSLPERTDLFEQAKKRIHRIGQKNSCIYYILLSDRTIDQNIYNALKQKKDYTDELFRIDYNAS